MPHLWVPVIFLRGCCPFLGLPGFLSLSTVDVPGQIILGWDGGGCLVPFRMFSILPALCPLDSISTKNVSRQNVPGWGTNCPQLRTTGLY